MNNDVEEGIIEKNEPTKVCPWWAESIPIVLLLIVDVLICKYYIDQKCYMEVSDLFLHFWISMFGMVCVHDNRSYNNWWYWWIL